MAGGDGGTVGGEVRARRRSLVIPGPRQVAHPGMTELNAGQRAGGATAPALLQRSARPPALRRRRRIVRSPAHPPPIPPPPRMRDCCPSEPPSPSTPDYT